jgi:septal ring-binding cell division protein DamX
VGRRAVVEPVVGEQLHESRHGELPRDPEPREQLRGRSRPAVGEQHLPAAVRRRRGDEWRRFGPGAATADARAVDTEPPVVQPTQPSQPATPSTPTGSSGSVGGSNGGSNGGSTRHHHRRYHEQRLYGRWSTASICRR